MRLAKDLVRLERDESLVLMNGRFPRPLVFTHGRSQVRKAIANPETIDDPELRELLERFRIMVPDGPEESPKTHQVFHDSGKTDLGLYLLVTQSCNLGCRYCLGQNESYLNSEKMDIETAKRTITQAAAAMAPGGSIQLIYFGGEPLLNWPVVRECIKWVDRDLKGSCDVSFLHHVTTNLTRLPGDFLDVAEAHGVTVLVDIDGPEETHDELRPYASGKPSYGRITRNLELLSDRGIYFELRATITSNNVGQLQEIQAHHEALGPSACAFPTLIPVDSEGRAIDSTLFPDPGVFSEQLKAAISDGLFDLSNICPSNVIATRMLRHEMVVYGCGMILGNTAVVDHDGSVYPCIYFVGQDEFRLGNVNETDDALSQRTYRHFFEKYASRLHVDGLEGCSECAIRYFCGGGCSIRMLSLQEDDERTHVARDYFKKINCAASWASVDASIDYFIEKAGEGGVKLSPQCRL